MTGIAFGHEDAVTHVIYVAAASGGVWKGDLGGSPNWRPLTDSLPTQSCGSIAVAASYPYTVYLGTGDARGARNSFPGLGVFKSIDRGASWTAMSPLDPARAPGNRTAIPSILPDSYDTDRLLVAVKSFTEENVEIDGGVYLTVNGGAGWSRVLGGGLPAGSVRATSLALDPFYANTIYAALGDSDSSPNNGVYKSIDRGLTFTKLAGGLPASGAGRILLAVDASTPGSLLMAAENAATGGLLGMWRTQDGGASWQQLPANGASCTRCKQEMAFAVSPADPSCIFFGAQSFFRSTDGGQFFTKINTAAGKIIHLDTHALAFDPLSAQQLWVGTDGGVTLIENSLGATPLSYLFMDAGLNITQFYGVGVHPTAPGIASGGSQDNGLFRFTGSSAWQILHPGDAGTVTFDPVDPNWMFEASQGGGVSRYHDGGFNSEPPGTGFNRADRGLFYTPFELDPRDPSILYAGTYRLYRSSDHAAAWQIVSGDLAVDPDNPNDLGFISAMGAGGPDMNVIYVGATNGQINVTSNLGASWTHIDNPPLPHRWVSSFLVSTSDSSTAYVSYRGFDAAGGRGHVFKTMDRGATWTDVTGSLPDVQVHHLVFDVNLPSILYAGTDAGVYATTSGGRLWRQVGQGLPNAPVLHLSVRASNLITATAHGRGAWEVRGCGGIGVPDADADGVADACDDCPGVANPVQTDADFDGFGAACDCDDADAGIHPGQPEIVCDGRDNNCNGSVDEGQAPPAEVGATVSVAPSGAMTWIPEPLAVTYNLYRGERAPTAPFAFNHACLQPGLGAPAAMDAANPLLGRAFYYLVSSKNCEGESGLGQGSPGSRPNAAPCP